MALKIKSRVFTSAWDSWDELAKQAADFASTLGDNRIISISHSQGRGSEGTIIIWYYE